MFTWPNWSPPTYFRQTPGGHASVPGIRQERGITDSAPGKALSVCVRLDETCLLKQLGNCWMVKGNHDTQDTAAVDDEEAWLLEQGFRAFFFLTGAFRD